MRALPPARGSPTSAEREASWGLGLGCAGRQRYVHGRERAIPRGEGEGEVKILKAPKFDATKLAEIHSGPTGDDVGAKIARNAEEEAAKETEK